MVQPLLFSVPFSLTSSLYEDWGGFSWTNASSLASKKPVVLLLPPCCLLFERCAFCHAAIRGLLLLSCSQSFRFETHTVALNAGTTEKAKYTQQQWKEMNKSRAKEAWQHIVLVFAFPLSLTHRISLLAHSDWSQSGHLNSLLIAWRCFGVFLLRLFRGTTRLI